MCRVSLTVSIAFVLLLAAVFLLAGTNHDWAGIDEKVVEHIAVQHGRPPRDPFINTDRGDLLLFAFLTAGSLGGFLAGYLFRGLFPPRKDSQSAPSAALTQLPSGAGNG